MDRILFLELVQNLRLTLGKCFQRDFMDVVFDLVFFFVIGEFVHENPFTLVSPQSDHEYLWLEPQSASRINYVFSDAADAFEYPRQLPHVKNIVEFGWCREETKFDLIP